jgi:hypothetical protein
VGTADADDRPEDGDAVSNERRGERRSIDI